jgi:hypothetical protein
MHIDPAAYPRVHGPEKIARRIALEQKLLGGKFDVARYLGDQFGDSFWPS